MKTVAKKKLYRTSVLYTTTFDFMLSVPLLTNIRNLAFVILHNKKAASCVQGDQSPDNVQFPDGSRHSSAVIGMLSVTHIMPVIVLLSVVGVGMQQCMIRKHIFIT